MRDEPANSQRVAMVVVPGSTPFEFGIASEIFGNARWADFGVPWYRFAVCGAAPGPVELDGGTEIFVRHGLHRVRNADTVVVLPTERLDLVPASVLAALRAAHNRGARVLSLCTGAFVLARAGLLDGRRATTHWSDCAQLAREHPEVAVDPGVLYVDEGDVLTSAGSAASIDLCLHVVRHDYGADVATQLARQLVVPPQRHGGQAQYIAAPLPEIEGSDLFSDTLTWLQGHLDEPVTVDDLAARAAMSPRTFARRFVSGTGTTPYQWLIRQRVQLAQRLLESGDASIESVASASGFCTAANLRKHFNRVVHTSPQQYRRTFQNRIAG